jgi:Zn-dependent peptidase ImmA (M78 family)
MAGGSLPAQELSELFATMRAQPQVWMRPIDSAAESVAAVLAEADDKPAFEQGRSVARRLREHLSVGDSARAEPADVLAQWHIPVVDVRLSSPQLDAISVWGPRHGPAVIVNRNGRHSRANGRRATLAHEIGHLVMDRGAALPVAEVLGGRISSRVEMRARAFAAEFLLPESVAGQAVMQASTVKDLQRIVGELSSRYGASVEIVAWQAANAHDRRLPPMIASYLKSKVSNPQAF